MEAAIAADAPPAPKAADASAEGEGDEEQAPEDTKAADAVPDDKAVIEDR